MPRGGARAGAGRPKGSATGRKPDPNHVTVRYPPGVIPEVDRLAEAQGITRSEWLIRVATSQLQAFRPR